MLSEGHIISHTGSQVSNSVKGREGGALIKFFTMTGGSSKSLKSILYYNTIATICTSFFGTLLLRDVKISTWSCAPTLKQLHISVPSRLFRRECLCVLHQGMVLVLVPVSSPQEWYRSIVPLWVLALCPWPKCGARAPPSPPIEGVYCLPTECPLFSGEGCGTCGPPPEEVWPPRCRLWPPGPVWRAAAVIGKLYIFKVIVSQDLGEPKMMPVDRSEVLSIAASYF